MYKGSKIVVITPAYNVEDHIETVLRTIPSFVDRVIIVDDASRDHTRERVQPLLSDKIVMLEHHKNQGVGGAMVTGYTAALQGEGDIFIKVDGDGQMDTARIPQLLDPLIEEGYAYAKGNRFLHAAELGGMPLERRLGNFCLTFLNKVVSGYWHVFDPQNGFFAVTREALSLIDLRSLSKRYFFENDMLIHLNIHWLRVKDVPIPARYATEKSSMKLSRIFLSFPFLFIRRFFFRMYQRYVLRDFSPVIMFLVTGSLLMLWGLIFGGYHWHKSIVTQKLVSTGTIMVALLPFLMGFELVLQAINMDIQATPK